MSDDNSLHQGFIRQRRNLIIVSLFLFFYEQVGLTIKDINLLGTNFEINDPSQVSVVVWVAWAYLVIRYLQYMSDYKSKDIKNTFSDARQIYLHRIASKIYKKHYYSRLKIADRSKKRICRFVIQPKGFPKIITPEHKSFNVSVKNMNEGAQDSDSYVGHEWTYKSSVYDLYRTRVYACYYLVIKTRLATEYFLPLIIAAFPLILYGVRAVIKSH